MKKFFDKYLFIKFNLQLVASIVTVLGGALLISELRFWALDMDNTLFQKWIWGFQQVSSPASGIKALESISSMPLGLPFFILLGVSFISWFISIAVYSFITGAIVNAFRNRQQMINEGSIKYSFKEHGIIIGWNVQSIAVVRKLLSRDDIKELLIVSGQKAQELRGELKLALPPKELDKVFIYSKNIRLSSTLRAISAEWSRLIVVLGDRNGTDNNGVNMRIVATLSDYIHGIPEGKKLEGKKKLYLNIDNTALYLQSRNMELPATADSVFDVEIYNYYESWAWQCWSASKGKDPDGDYLPIRYKHEAERAELFVIGSTPMGQAFVNYAMPLMTYGNEGRHNRITLFDAKADAARFLPKQETLSSLPEVEVQFVQRSGDSEEANELMLKAALREDTAVTVVIAIANPDEAANTYLQLSNSLRRQPISVLLCQATDTADCIDKRYLQTGGDSTILRYFGMTDCIPWMDTERQMMGKAVNYYYKHKDELPHGEDPSIVTMAPAIWNEAEADRLWQSIKRWEKWSSINSGDSFKEKSFVFSDGALTSPKCRAMLHAEHNRWWTERILDGWILGERCNDKFIHDKMVPFDKLDALTADNDRINIAAMARHGFLKN